jgi:hypothetical protein
VRQTVDSEAIHIFFGLSYSSYLVLPRTALQSAPDEWQRKFVDLLNELEEMFPQMSGTYWVRKQKDGKFVHDELADHERGRRKLARADAAEGGRE